MTMLKIETLLRAYAEAWKDYATNRTLAANETNKFYGARVHALEQALHTDFGLTSLDLGQLALAADSKTPDEEMVEYYIHQILVTDMAEAV